MQLWKPINLALNVIFPARCPICDKIVTPFGEKICPSCKSKIEYAYSKSYEEGLCMKCGKPLKNTAAEYCNDCLNNEHVFDRGFALYKYRSVSGSIYRFKYMKRPEYASFYADDIVDKMGPLIRSLKSDVIIPVPMHPLKQNKRGYNQAAVLTKAIGRRMDIPVNERLVERVKNTVPMKELDSHGRRNNLKGAFNIKRNDVKLLTIIVVDDIYTTGSTADAVALELKRAGARKVYVLSLAIGQGV